MTRKPGKPRVRVTVEQVVSFVANHGIVTENEVAECLNISSGSARRKLDGGVERGVLLRDDYDAEGHPIRLKGDWRYCVAS